MGAWCADLLRDRLNCGACGLACAPGATCDAGRCADACDGPGRAACDGACVDLFADARHCGACGAACGPTQACEGATCRDACEAAGLARCGDGCADLAADAAHCGACGRACQAGAVCQAGRCAAAACQGGLSLSGAPDLVVPVWPGGLLAGDLDGDGVPDLLVSEFRGEGLRLARGLPAGGFAPPEVAWPTKIGVHQLADVDGDGDLDVLAAATAEVLWLLNDGAGHLSRGAAYPAYEVRFARAVDLDGDGTLEVLAADGYTVRVWRSGPAGPAETYFAWSIRDLAVADLDGDGRPDLVLANGQGTSPVALYRNQGDGTFVEGPGVDPGHYPESLVVADLDGDGRLDLATRGFLNRPPWGETLAVVPGAPGGFGPAEVLPLPETAYRYDLLAADVDGDADLDLVVGELAGFRVFPNLGGGAFGEPELVRAGGAQVLAALDVDRDGLVDLVAASAPVGAVEVRRRRAGGGWDGPAFLPVVADQALLADLDGDGRDDLVTLRRGDPYAGRPTAAIQVRLGGPAGLGPPVAAAGFEWGRLEAGDLDGDGVAELLVTRWYGTPGVLRFRSGALQPEVPILLPGMDGEVRLADVDGDGRLDLVGLPGGYPYVLRVARGTGVGTFGAPVELPALVHGTAPTALADLDGDGRADLVTVTGYPPSRLQVQPGLPDGTFGDARVLGFTLPGEYPSLTGSVVADLDGDGRVEVAFGVIWSLPWPALEAGAVVVFEDEGGTLTATSRPVETPPEAVLAAPVRAADRPELVLLGRHTLGATALLAGEALAPERRWAAPDARGTAALGDVDGDLRPDLVVPVGEGLLLYRGGCLP